MSEDTLGISVITRGFRFQNNLTLPAIGMRRLNVQFTQIEECIRTSLFAVDSLPRNPPLERREVLLLQLVKADAQKLGKLKSRIEFALIFDRVTEDVTGEISRRHWPNAGKVWRYILHSSATIATAPFSLEHLKLSRDYSGQTNAMYIQPSDAEKIEPFLSRSSDAAAFKAYQTVHELLSAIRNHDLITRLSPTTTLLVREHEKRKPDPWLGNALKTLYEHRCQICTNDFRPRYSTAYADTRIIRSVQPEHEPLSKDLLVLCPNHNAIIGASKATFDFDKLLFTYPNGLVEKLMLRDHLVA